MFLRQYGVWGALLAVIFLGACEDGDAVGRFSWDATVTELNLTGLGVPVENALPSQFAEFELEPGEATILWRSSGSLFSVAVFIEIDEKDDGFLGIGAEDGEDRNLLFEFIGGQLRISQLLESHTGAEF